MSTCGKCGSHSFKLQRSEPSGSQFVVYFVQCSSCGTPVGVLEYANSTAGIEKLERKIDKLSNDVSQIEYDISLIRNQIGK